MKIGKVDLLKPPCIIVAVRDTDDPAAIDGALAAGAGVLEYRVDLFSRRDPASVRDFLARHSPQGRLLTIRAAFEGGEWADSEQARLALYRELIPHVDAVDIELAASEIRGPLIADARAAGKLVIASHHNFDCTPERAELDALANDSRAAGAHVIKVAAKCHSLADVQTLAGWTLAHTGSAIAVGMGACGSLTRVFFPALGSLATYTFIGQPSAPGQLTCADTIQYLQTFYPKMNLPGAQ